jgi:hypothetical protein
MRKSPACPSSQQVHVIREDTMACKLTRIAGGTFQGRTGARVAVDVRSDARAKTVRIAYAGEQDGQAPFEFTVKRGLNQLLVVALGVQDGQKMTVVEVGTDDCPLRRFAWSTTHFFTAITIQGI